MEKLEWEKKTLNTLFSDEELVSFIDSFYSWIEKRRRTNAEIQLKMCSDDYISGKDCKPVVYTMPMKSYEKGFCGFLKALKSWSVGLVYGPLLAVIITIIYMIKANCCQVAWYKNDNYVCLPVSNHLINEKG